MEEIQRLREYFNSVEIPKGKVKINSWLASLGIGILRAGDPAASRNRGIFEGTNIVNT